MCIPFMPAQSCDLIRASDWRVLYVAWAIWALYTFGQTPSLRVRERRLGTRLDFVMWRNMTYMYAFSIWYSFTMHVHVDVYMYLTVFHGVSWLQHVDVWASWAIHKPVWCDRPWPLWISIDLSGLHHTGCQGWRYSVYIIIYNNIIIHNCHMQVWWPFTTRPSPH